MSTRTFDYKDDKSSKFWEVTQAGSNVTVRYGKTGTTGQTQEKVFVDAASAGKRVSKLIAEKTGKGYVERGSVASFSVEPVQTQAALVEQVAQPVSKPKAKTSAAAKPVKPKAPAQDPEASAESLMAYFGKDDATNRLLAKHPRASGELLEKLSHSSDKATRQGVAGNPNAPSEILQKLGGQFPRELLNNPALDWMVLENPGLFSEIPEETLTAIAKREDCSSQMLGYLAHSGHGKGLLMSLLQNGKTPAEAIRYLNKKDEYDIAQRFEVPENDIRKIKKIVPLHHVIMGELTLSEADVIFWRELSKRLLWGNQKHRELAKEARIPDVVMHEAWATMLFRVSDGQKWAIDMNHMTLPSPLLEVLATKSDKKILKKIKEQFNCPEYLLGVLETEDVNKLVEANFDQDSLHKIIKTESNLLKLYLSDHPGCYGLWNVGELLRSLISSDDEDMLSIVLTLEPRVDDVTVGVLLESSYKNSPGIIACLAGNASISADALNSLYDWLKNSKDKGSYWRDDFAASLSRNPNVSDELLAKLYKDGFKVSRSSVMIDASLIREKFKSAKTKREMLHVASSPLMPDDVARGLIEIGGNAIYQELSNNKFLTASAIDVLASKCDARVYENLATHPNASDSVLCTLSKHAADRKNKELVQVLLKNPRLSSRSITEILQFIAVDHSWGCYDICWLFDGVLHHSNTNADVLAVLLNHPQLSEYDNDYAKIACHPGLSVENMFEILNQDWSDEEIKLKLIANPSRSKEVLNTLSLDMNISVAKKAANTLKRIRI